MADTFHLTPLTGTLLFLVLVFCGRGFRQVWKAQAPGWIQKAWIYAVPAFVAFLALAFIPMKFAG